MKPTVEPGGKAQIFRDRLVLGAALLIALLHGLVYLFIVPPWQHYDEPNHFEVVWLTAQHGRFPSSAQIDIEFSRAVVKSMIANDFYANMGFVPDTQAENFRIPGYDQFDEPPLYYSLAAIPLMAMKNASIESQLRVARSVSLFFLLVTILTAWGIVSELFAPGHVLRWLLPVSVAMTPAFVDVMTAVNNDSAAVAVSSFFLWGSLRLVRHGFSVLDLFWISGAAVIAYFTKNTALSCLIILPIALLFSLLRGRLRWAAWSVLLAGSLLVILAGLRWGDALYWHRATSQPAATRQVSTQAVLGKSILVINDRYPETPYWIAPLTQLLLPQSYHDQAENDVVTLGVWMWASQPVQARLPALNSNFGASAPQIVNLNSEPVFYAYYTFLSQETRRAWVSLEPSLSPGQAVIFYYDGFVLARGQRPLDQPPRFTVLDGSRGEWGGQPFENIFRNPSVEQAGLRIQPRLDNWSAKLLPNSTRASMLLSSLLDWPATGWYMKFSWQLLLERFWAVFGWAHVKLANPVVYRLMETWMILGALAAIVAVARRRQKLPVDVIFMFGLVVLAVWAITLLRGVSYLFDFRLYHTVARHTYPVIILVMLMLLYGWLEIARGLEWGLKRISGDLGEIAQNRTVHLAVVGLFLGLLLALDGYAIYSILMYYRG
jgi:hypothetical protein